MSGKILVVKLGCLFVLLNHSFRDLEGFRVVDEEFQRKVYKYVEDVFKWKVSKYFLVLAKHLKEVWAFRKHSLFNQWVIFQFEKETFINFQVFNWIRSRFSRIFRMLFDCGFKSVDWFGLTEDFLSSISFLFLQN